MVPIPHEIEDEFPEHAERISELSRTSAEFADLLEVYRKINLAVVRAETGEQPTDDVHLTELRKQRLALKDQIYVALTHPA